MSCNCREQSFVSCAEKNDHVFALIRKQKLKELYAKVNNNEKVDPTYIKKWVIDAFGIQLTPTEEANYNSKLRKN